MFWNPTFNGEILLIVFGKFFNLTFFYVMEIYALGKEILLSFCSSVYSIHVSFFNLYMIIELCLVFVFYVLWSKIYFWFWLHWYRDFSRCYFQLCRLSLDFFRWDRNFLTFFVNLREKAIQKTNTNSSDFMNCSQKHNGRDGNSSMMKNWWKVIFIKNCHQNHAKMEDRHVQRLDNAICSEAFIFTSWIDW